MLRPAFTKSAAANIPTAHTPGKDHLHSVGAIALLTTETSRQTKLGTRSTQQPRGWLGQQSFAGPIHQPETLLSIERKYRHVDLGHDRTQQCSGLERSQPLLAQCLPEVIHLEHDLAQRITRGCTSTANGIVAFANGRENI